MYAVGMHRMDNGLILSSMPFQRRKTRWWTFAYAYNTAVHSHFI